MCGVPQGVGRLDERTYSRVIRNRRIALVDVEPGRPLEAHGAGGDDEVADVDLVAQDTARADADEGRVLSDRQQLGDDDLDVVSANPGRHARDAFALVDACRRRELAV